MTGVFQERKLSLLGTTGPKGGFEAQDTGDTDALTGDLSPASDWEVGLRVIHLELRVLENAKCVCGWRWGCRR